MSPVAACRSVSEETTAGQRTSPATARPSGCRLRRSRTPYVYITSTTYTVPDGASAREIYEVGVRHLDAGLPAQAHGLIFQAIAGGYDSAEVQLHWLLAMLSKRSYRDLKLQERENVGAGGGGGRALP